MEDDEFSLYAKDLLADGCDSIQLEGLTKTNIEDYVDKYLEGQLWTINKVQSKRIYDGIEEVVGKGNLAHVNFLKLISKDSEQTKTESDSN